MGMTVIPTRSWSFNWSETCSGLAKYVNTVSTGALMSIDLLTKVNAGKSFQYRFKAFGKYHQQIPLQYIDYICKKENANDETLFFVFSYYANDQSDL
jgi:hypothetical protein